MATNSNTGGKAFPIGVQGAKPAGGTPTKLSPAPGGGVTKKISNGGGYKQGGSR